MVGEISGCQLPGQAGQGFTVLNDIQGDTFGRVPVEAQIIENNG